MRIMAATMPGVTGAPPGIWNRGGTPRWPPGGHGEPALLRLEFYPR